MPDWIDPAAVMATNPYLMQLPQQAPDWRQVLSNALIGVGAGISNSDASGRGWGAGIGPGLAYANQMTGQQRQHAEQEQMRRLQIGLQLEKFNEERQQRQRQQEAIDAYAKAPPIGFNASAPATTLGPGPRVGTPDQVAIAGNESAGQPNGGYGAVGPVANKNGDRGWGKYQVLTPNVAPWTKQYLGKEMTPQEFLANPQAQDAVFNGEFGRLQQKYGPVGAATAWFAGEGGMNNPDATDVNGMSVRRYGQQFAANRPGAAPGGAGPTFSALPAFEGPGMGAIQPGALPPGVEPSINLPPAFTGPSALPPFQIPGMPTSTSAPMPQPPQLQPQPQQPQVDPNIVPVQYTPTPSTPSMVPSEPPARVRRPPVQLPPEVNARINQAVAARIYTIPQGDALKHQIVQDEQRRRDAEDDAQHAARVKAWEVNRTVETEQRKIAAENARHDRDAAERRAAEDRKAAIDAANAARSAANQDVNIDPVTGQPVVNKTAVDAKASIQAAQGLEAKKLEMEYGPAEKLREAEMTRYSKDVRPAIEANVASLPNLYEMKRLTEGPLASGAYIDQRQAAARFLDTLGIQPMSNGMINRTEFNNRAGKNVLAILQTGSLGRTQISEGDRKFTEAMSAKGEFTTEEVKRLTDIAIDAAHTSVKQHDMTVKRLKALSPSLARVGEDFWKVEAPTYKEWTRDNPPAGVQTQQMGSTYTPQLASGNILQNMPQPRSKAEYDALPPGAPYFHTELGVFKTKPVKR